jgi:glycosyltransferase involved in cell wall biosynthesis
MKPLVILTSRFPYPPGEEFLKNEVDELSKYFSVINIMPTTSPLDLTKQKELPANVSIVKPAPSSRFGRMVKLLSDFQALGWFINELPNASRHGIKAVLKLLNWTAISSEIKRNLLKEGVGQDSIYYSYWLTPSATALAMLRDTGKIKNAVSRVHGGDLYWERHDPAYLPFQRRVLATLNQTFSISANGKEYLTGLHHLSGEKISVSRLGTKNNQRFTPAVAKPKILKIVSCSYLKPVKRIHLLLEALKKVDVPVEWTHIGDGPERGKLEMMAKELPGHISVQFLGNLNNKEVLKQYQTHHYDLFVNVSESEGIPVTIMEAFSFGTPVIATNVGGTSELVNEENGYLLPKDFLPENLADNINQYYRLDLDGQNHKAQSAYEKWNQEYNAIVNYQRFADCLKGVSK